MSANIFKGRWVGYLFSAGCICILAWNTDWGALVDGFRNISAVMFLVATCLVMTSYFGFSYRWWELLNSRSSTSLVCSLRSYLIGHFLNNLLMLRAGDIYRVNWLRKQSGWNAGSAMSALLTERITDILSLGGFSIFVFANVNLPREVSLAMALLILAGLVLLLANIFLRRIQRTTRRLALRVGFLLSRRAGHSVWRFVNGMASGVLPPGTTGMTGLYVKLLSVSVLAWLFNLAAIFTVLSVFLNENAVGAAITVMVITNFGLALPTSPGGVGVYHSLVVVALLPFEINFDSALAIAFVLHAVNYVPMLVAGTVAFLRNRPEAVQRTI
ncbi:flippase-like domain-containing protein [Thalassospira sp. HF15]|uniref:lysylphosphatidylglycerol synthase transmembrane domain-containing protein n=1 Tax=Thalassospira sp. HF15 TaxID=2722755 RepID=UPI00142FE27C|nr:lysylphosphatidylglycerol synthase transmembrane domain-containing protein [Thalassospira sp. HF15]NIY75420.1 flippase-like domain-containing protein [Thalassospira sp. HF15]